MKNYSKKIDERVNNPKNFGEITKQEAQSLGCKLVVADFESNGNDTLRVYFAITKDKIVFNAKFKSFATGLIAVSYTHLRAHETVLKLECRLLLDKTKIHSS